LPLLSTTFALMPSSQRPSYNACEIFCGNKNAFATTDPNCIHVLETLLTFAFKLMRDEPITALNETTKP
jgi:hypothetical protein